MLDDNAVDIGAYRLHVVGVSQQNPEYGDESQSIQWGQCVGAGWAAQQVPPVPTQREANQYVVCETCNIDMGQAAR